MSQPLVHVHGCTRDRAYLEVLLRCANYSAFNGYHRTASAYSTVVCAPGRGGCGGVGRTNAGYVAGLPDAED